MGLKTTNYEIKNIGIILDSAYAKITAMTIDVVGNVKAIIGIQQARNTFDKELLESIELNFITDKTENVYERAYNEARTVLTGWEDDLPEPIIEDVIDPNTVVETPTEEPTIEEIIQTESTIIEPVTVTEDTVTEPEISQ